MSFLEAEPGILTIPEMPAFLEETWQVVDNSPDPSNWRRERFKNDNLFHVQWTVFLKTLEELSSHLGYSVDAVINSEEELPLGLEIARRVHQRLKRTAASFLPLQVLDSLFYANIIIEAVRQDVLGEEIAIPHPALVHDPLDANQVGVMKFVHQFASEKITPKLAIYPNVDLKEKGDLPAILAVYFPEGLEGVFVPPPELAPGNLLQKKLSLGPGEVNQKNISVIMDICLPELAEKYVRYKKYLEASLGSTLPDIYKPWVQDPAIVIFSLHQLFTPSQTRSFREFQVVSGFSTAEFHGVCTRMNLASVLGFDPCLDWIFQHEFDYWRTVALGSFSQQFSEYNPHTSAAVEAFLHANRAFYVLDSCSQLPNLLPAIRELRCSNKPPQEIRVSHWWQMPRGESANEDRLREIEAQDIAFAVGERIIPFLSLSKSLTIEENRAYRRMRGHDEYIREKSGFPVGLWPLSVEAYVGLSAIWTAIIDRLGNKNLPAGDGSFIERVLLEDFGIRLKYEIYE